jgi:hypothetical protein
MKKWMVFTLMLLSAGWMFGALEWCGDSFIIINNLWYTGSNAYVHDGGHFNGANLGELTSLTIGGEIKSWDASGDIARLHYNIDAGSNSYVQLNTTWTSGGDRYFQKDPGDNINISGLTSGSHTLTIWFEAIDTDPEEDVSVWDSHSGDNYVATFTVPIANHATSFAAVTGGCYEIDLSWTDAAGPGLPEAYLIKASTTNYESIGTPVDGTPESDATLVKNVTYGTESVTFSGLSANTAYYFKIWPYYGSGASIDYKTDGTVPTATVSTLSVPPTPAGFSAAASGYDDIQLSWDAYTYADYDIMIVYNTDGGEPATPADGIAYTNGYSEHFSGTVVNLSGSETGYLHESLSEGTYYYYAWLKNVYDNYSTYATTNAEPALPPAKGPERIKNQKRRKR